MTKNTDAQNEAMAMANAYESMTAAVVAASVAAVTLTPEELLVHKLDDANDLMKKVHEDWKVAREKLRARQQLEMDALEAEHNITIREAQITYSQVELQLIKERQKAAK